jgi:transposase
MLKARVFSGEFKEKVVQRMLNGESVSALHHELDIKRSVLYRWFHAHRKEGAAGLQRARGRPPGVPKPPRSAAADPGAVAAARIAELERKVAQQALDLDFFRRAFKRVKELRQKDAAPGAPASTEKSEP